MRRAQLTLLLVIVLIVLTILCYPSVDRYHSSIGGGSPGFVRYAIRGGYGYGGCGCGYRPDGRPYCDMTGPISY